MPNTHPRLWVGPTFLYQDFPGQDRFAGSLIGTPTGVTGLDPVGYGRDALANFLGGASAEMLGPQLKATAQARGASGAVSKAAGGPDFGITDWLEDKTRPLAIGVAGALVALIVIALGIWYIVKG